MRSDIVRTADTCACALSRLQWTTQGFSSLCTLPLKSPMARSDEGWDNQGPECNGAEPNACEVPMRSHFFPSLNFSQGFSGRLLYPEGHARERPGILPRASAFFHPTMTANFFFCSHKLKAERHQGDGVRPSTSMLRPVRAKSGMLHSTEKVVCRLLGPLGTLIFHSGGSALDSWAISSS